MAAEGRRPACSCIVRPMTPRTKVSAHAPNVSLFLVIAAGLNLTACAPGPTSTRRAVLEASPRPTAAPAATNERATATKEVEALKELTADEARQLASAIRVKLHESGAIDPHDGPTLEQLRDAGATEADLVRAVRALVRACVDRDCEKTLAREDLDLLSELVAWLKPLGETATLGIFMRLDALRLSVETHSYQAQRSILVRRMRDAIAKSTCAPPADSEVAAARAALNGSATFEPRVRRVVARPLTPGELDDFAYFTAAITGASRQAVGEAPPGDTRPTFTKTAMKNAEREALRAEQEKAELAGDLRGVVSAARAYLVSLGYPGPIRGHEDSLTVHGPLYAYVMRDFAGALEQTGEYAEAAQAYRRAPVGGGPSGTGDSYRWRTQVEGVIRSEELNGACRRVVPERLLDIDDDVGIERLVDAGFDVLRLYRGAIATLYQTDVPVSQLRDAASALGAPLGPAARQRLDLSGPEPWEARVLALEGLAGMQGSASTPTLRAIAERGIGQTQLRALAALGRLYARPSTDPCNRRGWHSARGRNWSRKIPSLWDACETRPTRPDVDAIVRGLAPLTRSPDALVRESVAETLGELGTPSAKALLRALTNDPKDKSVGTVCTTGNDKVQRCRENFPVREAARDALERIAKTEEVPWPKPGSATPKARKSD